MSINPTIRQTFILRNEQPHSGLLKQPAQPTAKKKLAQIQLFSFLNIFLPPIRMGANGVSETFL